MAHIDDLMNVTSSKFHLTILAAKRAREINAYYQQLGEGTGRLVPPLVSAESNKPLTIALEEIAQGKIEEGEPVEVTSEDPLAFIEGADDVLSLVESSEDGPSSLLAGVPEEAPDDESDDAPDDAATDEDASGDAEA